MIDVIIPVYEARETLPYSLMSIAIQSICDKIKVTIVDDGSVSLYDDIVSFFQEFLNIQYFKLDNNYGGGVARQKGIDITSFEYIIFLDADDLFYDADSVDKLYSSILDGYDMVSGGEYDEDRNMTFINEGNLHGKIYRRSYIEKKSISFNDTRFHEDNYFNSYMLLSGAKNYNLFELVYVYCYNCMSITKVDSSMEFERLEILLYNMNQLYKNIGITEENRDLFHHFIFVKYKYFNRLYVNFNDEQKEQFRQWVLTYDADHINFIGVFDVDKLEKMVYHMID